MSRTTINTLALSLTAACLATLITACGTESNASEPMTRADAVADAARTHASDQCGQVRANYYSDPATSDVWQRHPELIGR